MVKIKAIFAKDKTNPIEFECQSFEEVKQKISKNFNVQPSSIKFMKPPIKDEGTFKKAIKGDLLQITFNGSPTKSQSSKPAEKPQTKDVKKQKQEQKIEQEISKPKKEDQRQIQVQDALDIRKKVLKDHKKRKIKERGLICYDDEANEVEDINVDHFTAILHLFRIITDARKFFLDYELKQRQPSGLFIEETRDIIKQIQGEYPEKLANPLLWVVSFMVHCADLIEENFPTFDLNYIAEKMIKVVEFTQRRVDPNFKPDPKPLTAKSDPNEDKTLSEVRRWFGIYLGQKSKEDKGEKEQQSQDDEDRFLRPPIVRQTKKEFLRYIFQCDLSESAKSSSIERSVLNMFDGIYHNINIIRLPKYIFVHLNHVGYPDPEEPDEWLENYDETKQKYRPKENKKYYQQNLKIPEILDAYPYSSKDQKDKNSQGKIHRVQTFHPLESYQRTNEETQQVEMNFKIFKQELKTKRGIETKYYTDEQIQFMFFQQEFLLDEADDQQPLFDMFYFQPEPKIKPSGQFRLMGIVFHKGIFYHQPNENHKNKENHPEPHKLEDCKGDMMTIVYKKNNVWLKFHQHYVHEIKLQEVQDLIYIKTKEKKQKRDPKTVWTPVMLLYRQICPPKSFNIVQAK